MNITTIAADAAQQGVTDLIARLTDEEARMQRLFDVASDFRDKHHGTASAFDWNTMRHAVSGRDPVLSEAAAALTALSEQNANLAAQVAELTRERDEWKDRHFKMREDRDRANIAARNYSEFNHEWRKRCDAAEAKVARLEGERPFIMGANHGYETAMEQVAAEARRYASNYPEASDGRNTFILFAEWAARAALTEGTPE